MEGGGCGILLVAFCLLVQIRSQESSYLEPLRAEVLEVVETGREAWRNLARNYREEDEFREADIPEKRQAYNPVVDLVVKEGEPCDYKGKEKFVMLESNLCAGKSCHPLEANCNGTVLRFSPHVNNTLPDYPDRISTSCFITKLRCYNQVTLSGYFYDLESMYGVKKCRVDGTLCYNGRTGILYDPVDVSNRKLVATETCHSQVLCEDGARYGYDFWGWKCRQQEVVCGGKVVSGAALFGKEIIQHLANCSIRERACDWKELETRQPCHNYSIVCPGNVTESGCIYSQLPLRQCPQSNRSDCVLRKIECEGVTYDATKYNGSIRGCIVKEMACEGGTRTETSDTLGNCTASMIQCQNVVYIRESVFPENAQNCTVQQLTCSSPKGCKAVDLACPGMPTCYLWDNSIPCLKGSECTGMQNTSSCICPLDREGEDCSVERSVSCSMKAVSPSSCSADQSLQVKGIEKLLDADWPCSLYGLEEKIRLGYLLECRFAEPVVPTKDQLEANFTYAIQTDQYALSEEKDWSMERKLFNFWRLADTSQLQSIAINKAQMEGKETIWVDVPPAKEIPDHFWAGNRLYMEIGWGGEHPDYGNTRVVYRRYIDTLQSKKTFSGSTTTTTSYLFFLFLALVAVVFAFILWKSCCTMRRSRIN